MKEINNFREYLNEAKFKVGDRVTMGAGGEDMEIIKARRMFGSNINAYTVKKADGDEVEYDESQLKLVKERKDAFSGYFSKTNLGRMIMDAEEILKSGMQNGEPLDNETEMLVHQELKKLKQLYVDNHGYTGMMASAEPEDINENKKNMKNFDLKKFLGEKSLLNENAPGYDTRKTGEALPTLESVKAAYEAKKEIKEGVWNMPSLDELDEFIAYMEDTKKRFYHIGSDDVHDGLERAIMAAKELLNMQLKEE